MRRRRAITRGALPVLIALAIAAPSEAHAQSAELHYDLRVDLPIAITAGTWFAISEFTDAKKELASKSCRWCDRNPDGSEGLNALDASVRDTLRWENTERADCISNFTGYGTMPIALGTITLAG